MLSRHQMSLAAVLLSTSVVVGCGDNSNLELQDIILAPDLELLDWDFTPSLTQGQGSDVEIEMRNKGAIDARRFRVTATLIKAAVIFRNNEGNAYDFIPESGRGAFAWEGRSDVSFLASLQQANATMPIQPTSTGEALFEITLDSREDIADPNRSDNTNTEPCGGAGCFDLGKPLGDIVIINGGSNEITAVPSGNS